VSGHHNLNTCVGIRNSNSNMVSVVFCADRGFRQKNRNPPHSEVPLMGQPKARVIGTPLDAKFENAVIKIPNLGDHVFSTPS